MGFDFDALGDALGEEFVSSVDSADEVGEGNSGDSVFVRPRGLNFSVVGDSSTTPAGDGDGLPVSEARDGRDSSSLESSTFEEGLVSGHGNSGGDSGGSVEFVSFDDGAGDSSSFNDGGGFPLFGDDRGFPNMSDDDVGFDDSVFLDVSGDDEPVVSTADSADSAGDDSVKSGGVSFSGDRGFPNVKDDVVPDDSVTVSGGKNDSEVRANNNSDVRGNNGSGDSGATPAGDGDDLPVSEARGSGGYVFPERRVFSDVEDVVYRVGRGGRENIRDGRGVIESRVGGVFSVDTLDGNSTADSAGDDSVKSGGVSFSSDRGFPNMSDDVVPDDSVTVSGGNNNSGNRGWGGGRPRGSRERLGLGELKVFEGVGELLGVSGGDRLIGGGVDNGRGVTVKDFDFLDFLGRFRYATARHLSNIHGVSVLSAKRRLSGLKGKKLVKEYYVFGREPVWCLSGAGLSLVNVSVPEVIPSRLSWALLNHSFVVNNTASGLMGGVMNTLFLPEGEFPVKNRCDVDGARVFGESLVGESEISSSLGVVRGLHGGDAFRAELLDRVDSAFREWELGGRVGESPEFLFGNEFMWALFPRGGGRKVTYHVPDFVVKRERGDNGEPRSIAVEVELSVKSRSKYYSTLGAFLEDRRVFERVVWVVRGSGQAKVLEEVARDIGLWQEGRMEIVPILTRDGVFDGRDIWLV